MKKSLFRPIDFFQMLAAIVSLLVVEYLFSLNLNSIESNFNIILSIFVQLREKKYVIIISFSTIVLIIFNKIYSRSKKEIIIRVIVGDSLCNIIIRFILTNLLIILVSNLIVIFTLSYFLLPLIANVFSNSFLIIYTIIFSYLIGRKVSKT